MAAELKSSPMDFLSGETSNLPSNPRTRAGRYAAAAVHDATRANGQWSMPARHKASPFWAQAVKRKTILCTCFGQTPFTSGRNFKTHQRVQPNVGGISPPPAMTPNLCIDRKHWFDNPTCAASLPKIGIEQMDSKQEFSGPSDVQVNLQCAELISNSAYKQGTTKVSLQLLLWTLGPDRSSDEEFHATRGTSQCQMEVLQMTDKVSEKGRQVKCTKLFFVEGTVATSEANHCWNASIEIFQPRIYWSCFVLQCLTICVHSFRALFHMVSEIHVLHLTSTSSQYAS